MSCPYRQMSIGTYGPQMPMYPCIYIYIYTYTQNDGRVWVGKDLIKVIWPNPPPLNRDSFK